MKRNLEIMEEFLASKKATKPESANTTGLVYESNLRKFFIYLKKYEGDCYVLSKPTIKNIVKIIERYMNYCRNELGNAKQTIINDIAGISAFYSWCSRRDYVLYNPVKEKVEKPVMTEQDKVRESYYLTWKEIFQVTILMEERFQKSKSKKRKYNYDKKEFDLRSRLMWQLFLDSGFRITPISSLKISQLELEKGRFKGIIHKRGKMKDLYFHTTARDLILELLEERKKLGVDTDYVFYTKYKQKWCRMCQAAIRKRVRKMGTLLGINGLYPHSLRKTSINNINNLIDLKSASEFAGHDNTITTENHYIKKQSAELEHDRITIIMKNKGLI